MSRRPMDNRSIALSQQWAEIEAEAKGKVPADVLRDYVQDEFATRITALIEASVDSQKSRIEHTTRTAMDRILGKGNALFNQSQREYLEAHIVKMAIEEIMRQKPEIVDRARTESVEWITTGLEKARAWSIGHIEWFAAIYTKRIVDRLRKTADELLTEAVRKMLSEIREEAGVEPPLPPDPPGMKAIPPPEEPEK